MGWPVVVAGEVDVFPAEWGEVREEGLVDGPLLESFDEVGGAFEVDGVPEDDGGGEEVESGCSVALVVEGSVADFAEAVEEHGSGERVAGFAFVESVVDASSKVNVLEPVEDEQGSFDAADFA